eukprot:1142311-Pelagomonas_calceolata.AAC.6
MSRAYTCAGSMPMSPQLDVARSLPEALRNQRQPACQGQTMQRGRRKLPFHAQSLKIKIQKVTMAVA